MDELEDYLTGLGADVVTTDDKLKAALGQHHMFCHGPFEEDAMQEVFMCWLACIAAAHVVHLFNLPPHCSLIMSMHVA